MRVEINRVNDAFHTEAVGPNGQKIQFDGSAAIGGLDEGFSPMQSLLAAMGGCSAIDVVLILKKQKQVLTALKIIIDGEREAGKEPALWKTIHAQFILTGSPLEKDKAERAVALSMDKYCSVAATLRAAGATITYDIITNG